MRKTVLTTLPWSNMTFPPSTCKICIENSKAEVINGWLFQGTQSSKKCLKNEDHWSPKVMVHALPIL